MMRRVATVLLACALSFSGQALARSHRNQSSPVHQCYWDTPVYSPGAYCVSRRGLVEVCLSGGDWMSIGPCIGEECRTGCPS